MGKSPLPELARLQPDPRGPSVREPVASTWPRSGLAAKNLLDTRAGVIDSDYTGEVKVLLFNEADQPFQVHKSDRIAQMVFMHRPECALREVSEITRTERGSQGGSWRGLGRDPFGK